MKVRDNHIFTLFRYFFVMIFLLFFACEEGNINLPTSMGELNGPIGITSIKGTNGYALLVVNSNYALKYSSGFISVIYVDAALSTYSFDYTNSKMIDNFGGQILLDSVNSRIYATNRSNDSVLVYDYTYNDNENKIEILAHAISDSSGNLISVGTNPYALALYSEGVNSTLLVTNITSADLYLIDTVNLEKITAKNGENRILLETTSDVVYHKGYGANRVSLFPDNSHAIVDSIYYNTLFFVDLNERALSGVAYLDSEFGSGGEGSRGIAISNDNKAYVVSRYLKSVLIIDLTKVIENGEELDVIENAISGSIPIGDKNSMDIEIYNNYLYVANYDAASISVIDINISEVIDEIGVGQGPTEIRIEGDKGFVTNFISDSISIIDLTTNELLLTIENE